MLQYVHKLQSLTVSVCFLCSIQWLLRVFFLVPVYFVVVVFYTNLTVTELRMNQNSKVTRQ